MMIVNGAGPGPVFDHLYRMSDSRGVFEHARYDEPRPEHGYCLDDVARALVVVCREPYPSPKLHLLGRRLLDFTVSALQADGACHNRMDATGAWTDRPAIGDWWGRALWGLGVAAVHAPTPAMRGRALLGFRTAARRRSPHLRAMAYAALGAGELLLARPDEAAARQLLLDVVAAVTGNAADLHWPWPEPRLTYSNGTIVEALLVAGEALTDRAVQRRGLYLLQFLLGMEVRHDHLSLTPVGGRGPSDPQPCFDQQPIEAAALGAACARAYESTGDTRWLDGLQVSWAWFLGDNDACVPMVDPGTGAGFDGLQRTGRNLNQGAESTLAALSTAQLAHHFVPLDRR
jgi:hypothetical protein